MNLNLRNKIAGAIYGFAIGDAMGATTEFMESWHIKRRYGQVNNILGGGWLNLNPGDVTDDTEMTMCVMDAIMKSPRNAEGFLSTCVNNFIDWLDSNPKDIGGQCHRAILELKHNREGLKPDKEALGNGSLMRAMPLAILGLEHLNICQGLITHNNPICSKVILAYSGLLQAYLYDRCMIKYTDSVKSLTEPSGHVLNTFNNSVYWSKEKTFKKAIIGAVNHGGDADTIAAITGSLAGARFGYEQIPQAWVNQLNPEVKIFLEKFKNFVFSYLQI